MQRSDKASIFSEILIELLSLLNGVCEKDLRKAETRSANVLEDGRVATCQFVCV
jgi:hypothetical protein